MTYSEAARWITKKLAAHHPNAEQAAHHLLSWATNRSQLEHMMNREEPIPQAALKKISDALNEHLSFHKPLPYIFGSVPFLSATINVRAPVLIPRPETEEWVAYLITLLRTKKTDTLTLLDLCTGSGCIAIALAQSFPQATIYAVDNAPEALTLAKENIQNSGCSNILLIPSDLYSELDPEILFDCIISNPPYVTTAEWEELESTVKEWEDPHALVAGKDGLSCLYKIIKGAPARLSKRSGYPHIALEIGFSQAASVTELLRNSNFRTSVWTDLAGKDRLVLGGLVDE